MKTTCFLLVTVFFTVVLVAFAAPAPSPTLNIICTTGDCKGNIQLDFANLDTGTTYTLTGVNTTSGDSCCGSTITPVMMDSFGNFNEDVGQLSTGTWEFVLTPQHKNGRPAHNPDIDDTSLTVPSA